MPGRRACDRILDREIPLFSARMNAILEDIRLEMAYRDLLRKGGLRKKRRNSSPGHSFAPAKRLTLAQKKLASAKFAYYVERAAKFGRDVSTQPKRHVYWMNAVRAVTLNVESFKKKRKASISRRNRYLRVMRKRQRIMIPVRKMPSRQLPL